MAAAIGALESVARLTGADTDRAVGHRRPLKELVHRRRGLAKAVGILEEVQRIVSTVANEAAEPDAHPPIPPPPAREPGGEAAGSAATPPYRCRDDSGGTGDVG